MNNYDFDSAKKTIINLFNNTIDENKFTKIFIVRNIYSRFSIYYIPNDNTKNYINEIVEGSKISELVDSVELLEDNFLISQLDKDSDKLDDKLYYSERRINTNNWYSEPKEYKNIVSFYSFKGGVGRTTAMILSAVELARKGKKIVLIDFDLEAPGIASIFSTSNTDYYSNKGILDLFIDLSVNKVKQDSNINLIDYYFSITAPDIIGTNGGELIIFPAASTSLTEPNNYIDKLSKVDLKYNENKKYLPDHLFDSINEEIKPDFILVDSRTGINEIAGVLLTRYSSKIFLLFYGNQQNMFGLEAIIDIIDKTKTPYVLINSPTPIQDTDKEEEINFYVEKSYDIFCKYNYNDKIPNIDDQTAPHYPINIPYSYNAVNFNSTKFNLLLNENGNNNPYKTISELIDVVSENEEIISSEKLDFYNISKYFSEITIDEIAVSEDEFKEESDLIKRFYPRKDYRYIFEPNKFLILGDKGTGKTALFSVLNHSNYSKDLAEYCGVNSSLLNNSRWITALDKSGAYPSQANFNQLKDFTKTQITNYWLLLLIRSLLFENKEYSDKFNHILECKPSDLKKFAMDENITEQVEDFLIEFDNMLSREKETIYFVYDYLDIILSPENGMRGRYIGALISFWHDYQSRLKNIKAKIFLRNDIFNREIVTETDKIKILNQAMVIEWNYDQLLNVVWKRLLASYDESDELKKIFDEFKGSIDFSRKEKLGIIPNLSEQENRRLLEVLFGKYMGANNKAFPYNWIIYHTSDANKKMYPRSILTLFSSTGKKQLEDKKDTKYPLRPFNMEISMNKVSKDRVVDLSEEYPSLNKIFENLNSVVQNFPVTDTDLIEALKRLGVEDPVDTIKSLNEIGVIYPYKYSSKKYGNRYHIPDLYLLGMDLKRRGPGAYKILYNKK
ncbi:MAG: AAA family ATPase [Spirochaetales bacterium]|nr:AAA family ATPase [Spirochaetales bacterium]